MESAKTEEIFLRWMPRRKSVVLLTEDQKEHRLTVEEAFGLLLGLHKVLPRKEVHALLGRKGW